ncbi:hypothetical protein AYK20_00100 [Thermoplasmatales archaeon SG8-52-1]|nr:MAG: hypothetical protein AYK20_00100 [Thermoplasmatales archaeon SG8-52-1]
MNGLILLLILIIALLFILGVIITIVLWKKQKENKYEEPDYQAFFIMGISFLPLGLVFMIAVNPAFFVFTGIGLCYIAIGLANKDKWKRRE